MSNSRGEHRGRAAETEQRGYLSAVVGNKRKRSSTGGSAVVRYDERHKDPYRPQQRWYPSEQQLPLQARFACGGGGGMGAPGRRLPDGVGRGRDRDYRRDRYQQPPVPVEWRRRGGGDRCPEDPYYRDRRSMSMVSVRSEDSSISSISGSSAGGSRIRTAGSSGGYRDVLSTSSRAANHPSLGGRFVPAAASTRPCSPPPTPRVLEPGQVTSPVLDIGGGKRLVKRTIKLDEKGTSTGASDDSAEGGGTEGEGGRRKPSEAAAESGRRPSSTASATTTTTTATAARGGETAVLVSDASTAAPPKTSKKQQPSTKTIVESVLAPPASDLTVMSDVTTMMSSPDSVIPTPGQTPAAAAASAAAAFGSVTLQRPPVAVVETASFPGPAVGRRGEGKDRSHPVHKKEKTKERRIAHVEQNGRFSFAEPEKLEKQQKQQRKKKAASPADGNKKCSGPNRAAGGEKKGRDTERPANEVNTRTNSDEEAAAKQKRLEEILRKKKLLGKHEGLGETRPTSPLKKITAKSSAEASQRLKGSSNKESNSARSDKDGTKSRKLNNPVTDQKPDQRKKESVFDGKSKKEAKVAIPRATVSDTSSAPTVLASDSANPKTVLIIKPDVPLSKQVRIDSRVAVYWEEEKQYFKGTVTKHRSHKRPWLVEYDDGDREWISFRKCKFKLLKSKIKARTSAPSERPKKKPKTEHPSSDSDTPSGLEQRPDKKVESTQASKVKLPECGALQKSAAREDAIRFLKKRKHVIREVAKRAKFKSVPYFGSKWVVAGGIPPDSSDSDTDDEELAEWANTMLGIPPPRPVAGHMQEDFLDNDEDDRSKVEVQQQAEQSEELACQPREQATVREPSGDQLSAEQLKHILDDGDFDAGCEASSALGSSEAVEHWVRRSARQPSKSALDSPCVKELVEKLRTDHPDMVVLKMKKYVNDPAAPSIVIDAALDALEKNTNCEALYIQNFNEGLRDNQMLHLLRILQMPSCNIWCLNIGEIYRVKRKTWRIFAKGLRRTKVTHMYASEHVIMPELKEQFRNTIRNNRTKHSMHCDPGNLDTIIRCTHNWWNPINTKSLRPYLRVRGLEGILQDREKQGLRGSMSGKTLT